MTPIAVFAVRVFVAACGLALIAAAIGPLRAPPRRAARGRSPAAWEHLLLRIVLLVAPAARRSELLLRSSSIPLARSRLAFVGSTSWVARAVHAFEDRGGRSRLASVAALDRQAEAFASLRAACALVALALALPLAWLSGGLIAAVLLLAALMAARLPDAALAAQARRARASVDVAMPAALELLAACCRGGIALESALAVTAAHAPPPLRGVLERARRRQRAGEPPASALRVEAEAVGVHEVAAIGRLVERHHQLGLPLEGPLLARAQAARARARIAALARAGRGVPLASLLVATVIAPCCVGILATWVILASIGQAGFAH